MTENTGCFPYMKASMWKGLYLKPPDKLYMGQTTAKNREGPQGFLASANDRIEQSHSLSDSFILEQRAHW